MKRLFFALAFFAVLLSGCTSPEPDSGPVLDPGKEYDVSGFLNAGCVLSSSNPGSLECYEIDLEERFKCMDLKVPSKYLSFLKPERELVECFFDARDDTSSEGIFSTGCMLRKKMKYIILVHAKDQGIGPTFSEIKSKADFASHDSPVVVENAEEALAYAVALTPSFPLFNPTIEKPFGDGTAVAIPDFNKTTVRQTGDGYIVNLFEYVVCGCGTHPYEMIEYSVSRSGEVKELSRKVVFEDKSLQVCVD